MTPESLVGNLASTPYSLELNDSTRPLIESLIEKALDLEKRYRVVHSDLSVFLRTDPEFRAFQTYHSNKLELQGPDLEETKTIIDEYSKQGEPDDLRTFAVIQAITKDSHLVEVLGQHQANILVERISESFSPGESLTQKDVRQLNQFCIQHERWAGEYRETDRVNIDQFFEDDDPLWFAQPLSHPVEVTWTDIPDEMRKICNYMNLDQECPLLAAAVAHAWFTRVHPFHDGNGRTARLIANLVLIRNLWPPLTVVKQHRDEYIDALRESDSGGDIRLLFDLFVQSMERGLAEIESPQFWRRRYQLEAQNNEVQRHNDWIDLARNFVNTLRKYIGNNGWTLERVVMPDRTTFQLLEEFDPTASVPIGWLRHPDKREIKIHVGYMSNELKQANHFDPTIGGHNPPTLYMRERNYLVGAAHPFVHRKNSRLEIKEFTFIPGENERQQSKVLYGNEAKTPIEMSITQLCQRIAREIEDLEFPGFEPISFLSKDTSDVLESIINDLAFERLTNWESIYVSLLTEISSGRLFAKELSATGIFMSSISHLTNTIGKNFEFLGPQNELISETIFLLLPKYNFGLAIVNSVNQNSYPILVRRESIRNRKMWTPMNENE